MIIKHLELKNQSYRSIKLNGLSVKCFLNGQGTFGSTSVDFSKSTISVILTRDSKQHVIYSGNLKIIGIASTLDTLNQLAFGTTLPIGQEIVAGQQDLVAFNIPFGGVVDLHGDDEIYIEVQNNAGLFTISALEAASYLEIKPIKCYGVERFIPRITAYVIQANEQSNQYMIGDNLIRLALLNYDKTDFTQNVVNNCLFTSDRLDENYTFADLILRKMDRFGKHLIPYTHPDVSLDIQEDQSFMITDFHEEYHDVKLELQFNGANVTAGNNYVVAWTFQTDWTILNKAAEKDAKHADVDAQRVSSSTLKSK